MPYLLAHRMEQVLFIVDSLCDDDDDYIDDGCAYIYIYIFIYSSFQAF